MARKKIDKDNYEMISPPIEEDSIPEELSEKVLNTFEDSNTEERKDIDFISEETETKEEPSMRIKEVKYGFSVLTNIGNFENIRTQIEVSAEIDDNEQLFDCIDKLSGQIKEWGRREYKNIKTKAIQTMPQRNIIK